MFKHPRDVLNRILHRLFLEPERLARNLHPEMMLNLNCVILTMDKVGLFPNFNWPLEMSEMMPYLVQLLC